LNKHLASLILVFMTHYYPDVPTHP